MLYWDEKGKACTDGTAIIAVKRAAELGIKNLVVASNSGETAAKLLNNNLNIICVTHHNGFKTHGENEMKPENRKKLEAKGVKLLTTTHLLAGVDRAFRLKFQGVYPAEIVAATLRLLGNGVKVCVEISVMALDAGLVPFGEEIVCVAGSHRGADTACVIMPAHSNYFFDTVVKEIICMPREK